jgi:hypothetical protein
MKRDYPKCNMNAILLYGYLYLQSGADFRQVHQNAFFIQSVLPLVEIRPLAIPGGLASSELQLVEEKTDISYGSIHNTPAGARPWISGPH